MASCAICSTVFGVVPVEPPTPALSKATTRRAVARSSMSAGSQLSRFSVEVLQQDERHVALAGVAVGVVDAVGRADQLVRKV
jgi:hypothetical protein